MQLSRSLKSSWALAGTGMLALMSAGIAHGFGDAAPAPDVYDVRQYGAVGDGKTLDTQAIQIRDRSGETLRPDSSR
jgi:polygalacturonase